MHYSTKKDIRNKLTSGFTLIEVMVSIGLASIVLLAITSLNVQTHKVTSRNMLDLRASLYLTEALEAAKDLEVSNWNLLKTATCTSIAPCHPSLPSGGGVWTLPSGSEVLDTIFTRSVWIESVYRNQCTFPNAIVATGGVICPSSSNPGTLKFVATLTWNDSSGPRTQKLETYLYQLP